MEPIIVFAVETDDETGEIEFATEFIGFIRGTNFIGKKVSVSNMCTDDQSVVVDWRLFHGCSCGIDGIESHMVNAKSCEIADGVPEEVKELCDAYKEYRNSLHKSF